jgi:23S rRNA (uracil1939-C5)-methyltransferase
MLSAIKQDIAQRGWSIYNEEKHRGNLRHLGLRIGHHTGEMLLLLVACNWNIPGLEEQVETWLESYPALVGVVVNQNADRTNTILGAESRCVAGRPYLLEKFLGLTLQILPDAFFQVNTEQAEALMQVVLDELALQGQETILDAYCGIGTLTLPLAKRVKRTIGIELQAAAIDQALQNAQINDIENVTFQIGAVEQILPALEVVPDVVVLDPPRKGCDTQVIQSLRQMQPARIVYVSCNPATLARDLKLLCEGQIYELQRIQPVDFFPQTAHVECVAFLNQRESLV